VGEIIAAAIFTGALSPLPPIASPLSYAIAITFLPLRFLLKYYPSLSTLPPSLPASSPSGPAKMRIAAALAPAVWAFVLLMYPLAYPIGWALDKLIPERSVLTSRAEVRKERRRDISGADRKGVRGGDPLPF
jgi:hypothetical protein